MQTIRLTYEAGLSPIIKLFTPAGVSIGTTNGYALTETAVGAYQTTVENDISGDPLVVVLEVNNRPEATDFVWLDGEAGSVAIVGVPPSTVSTEDVANAIVAKFTSSQPRLI